MLATVRKIKLIVINFEDVFLKILEVCSNPELLEVEYTNDNSIWVGYIYLEDNELADDYNFSWEIGKSYQSQSEETQQTLRLILIKP